MASIIKSDNGVSSGITGIVQSADSSGQLVLQTTTSSGTATTAVTIDNTQVATFANTLKAPNLQGPAFSAYQSSSQTLSSSTATKIQFQSVEFDTSSPVAYDTTNFRFLPKVAGYYQFSAALSRTLTATEIYMSFYKNGSEFKRGSDPASTYSSVVSALIYCNGTTDYVEVYGYIVGGGSLQAQNFTTYFQASMVRSA